MKNQNRTFSHLAHMLVRYYAILWELRWIGVKTFFLRDRHQAALGRIMRRLDILEREFDALIKEGEQL